VEGPREALIGPNGAGKTTLLKAISGTVAAAEGRIAYRGRDVDRLRPAERAALGIAHVPEGRRVFPSLTVMENLVLGSYRRAARPGRAEALETVLQLFPILKERRAKLAGSLSAASSRCITIQTNRPLLY
jgi:branched-chain amino acid transport system ATP-binding protein